MYVYVCKQLVFLYVLSVQVFAQKLEVCMSHGALFKSYCASSHTCCMHVPDMFSCAGKPQQDFVIQLSESFRNYILNNITDSRPEDMSVVVASITCEVQENLPEKVGVHMCVCVCTLCIYRP